MRDLSYSFDVDGYQGTDLTMLANHLFQRHRIVDWSFTTVPYSIAWCIRDDGLMLALTYLREQQVFAWAPQSTEGKFESTCSISEGNEDSAYFIVQRTVNGKQVRYVERLASRLFTRTEDAFFVDSGLSYDGRNTDISKTATITGGAGEWNYQENYPLVISGDPVFSASDIGSAVNIPYFEDNEHKELRCKIVQYVSENQVVISANRNIPPVLQNTPTTEWSIARYRFAGLNHLEGKTVNILSDANVSPQAIVTNGTVEIDTPSAVVHIGLPITSELETLDIHINGQETLLDKKKLIKVASLIVNSSRGIWAGTEKERLYEYPQRQFEFYDNPVDDATGIVEINLDADWSKNGRVFIRQVDPLPLAVLSVIPRIDAGGF